MFSAYVAMVFWLELPLAEQLGWVLALALLNVYSLLRFEVKGKKLLLDNVLAVSLVDVALT